VGGMSSSNSSSSSSSNLNGSGAPTFHLVAFPAKVRCYTSVCVQCCAVLAGATCDGMAFNHIMALLCLSMCST
jgi:fructose-1,6-bisphosphatase/inositol monophosphatase family enzyme